MTGWRPVQVPGYEAAGRFLRDMLGDTVATPPGTVSEPAGFWVFSPGRHWAAFICGFTQLPGKSALAAVDFDPGDAIETRGPGSNGVMGYKITAGTVSLEAEAEVDDPRMRNFVAALDSGE